MVGYLLSDDVDVLLLVLGLVGALGRGRTVAAVQVRLLADRSVVIVIGGRATGRMDGGVGAGDRMRGCGRHR